MATDRSGRADAARGLELLWKAGERQRPGLTLERIVRAAIEVADGEGLAALSMRRVADRLGFTTMSLYRHVPGKAELFDVMMDTVIAEVPLLDTVPGGWRAKLELGAREDWAFYHRHPWVLQAPAGRPALGPNGIAWYESALRALSGIGLTELQTVDTFHLVDGYVRGVARISIDAAQAERRTGVTDEQWWSDRAHFWEEFFDPARYPTLARVRAAGALDRPSGERGFEFGLQRVLDSIEMFVEARSPRPAGERDERPDSGRDETIGDDENGDGQPVCVLCGEVVPQAATGRPRDYCSRACQQRAYRMRRTAEESP
ncbi:TetR/AcrR family transcriptional regulator [Actinomadura sp. HBU206391]|uniref:TetR/AcrR family transcriptional regulator n=1 Tax=Actinomadura sp. HBU206391 TaxID=2731692 RepID=UPI0016501B59|nr:TetR/AcrR family transcriptional regulator [Actinomadura sp. HBU206391]MBC6456958.1 TetR/AcrR family transcriptional regulator [Actinomadura sp. HBU206391]